MLRSGDEEFLIVGSETATDEEASASDATEFELTALPGWWLDAGWE